MTWHDVTATLMGALTVTVLSQPVCITSFRFRTKDCMCHNNCSKKCVFTLWSDHDRRMGAMTMGAGNMSRRTNCSMWTLITSLL